MFLYRFRSSSHPLHGGSKLLHKRCARCVGLLSATFAEKVTRSFAPLSSHTGHTSVQSPPWLVGHGGCRGGGGPGVGGVGGCVVLGCGVRVSGAGPYCVVCSSRVFSQISGSNAGLGRIVDPGHTGHVAAAFTRLGICRNAGSRLYKCRHSS